MASLTDPFGGGFEADRAVADFELVAFEPERERDGVEPFDRVGEPDRLAGVRFLDDPQLDMTVPPYQPLTRQGRYPA